jgi:hypothetical protein
VSRRVRELEARLLQAEHDHVLLIRTIVRLARELGGRGQLEPSLRLVRGGSEEEGS